MIMVIINNNLKSTSLTMPPTKSVFLLSPGPGDGEGEEETEETEEVEDARGDERERAGDGAGDGEGDGEGEGEVEEERGRGERIGDLPGLAGDGCFGAGFGFCVFSLALSWRSISLSLFFLLPSINSLVFYFWC